MASIFDGMSGPLPATNQPGLYDVTGGFGSMLNQNTGFGSQLTPRGVPSPQQPLPPQFNPTLTPEQIEAQRRGQEIEDNWYSNPNQSNISMDDFWRDYAPRMQEIANRRNAENNLYPQSTPNYNLQPQGSPTTLTVENPIGANGQVAGAGRTQDPTASPRNTSMSPVAPPAPQATGMAGAMNMGFQNINNYLRENQAAIAEAQRRAQAGGATPSGQPGTPPQMNSQNQAWMDANKGNWGAGLMNSMMGGGADQFKFDPMNIQWNNFSNGKQENITRALGVLNNGDELAKMLGGQLVDSPFATFGTQQRDKYIKMPNGQMIEASALANSLQGASKSSNPFSAFQDVIGLYQRENAAFNPQTNTDAVNLANTGVLNPSTPQGWDPSKFAGGNPTYTPSGPVPGNPGNPGMGTSNPVQFQGGQINAVNGQNGFPMFNYNQQYSGLPNNGGLYNTGGTQTAQGSTPPASGGGTTLPPAPQAPNVPTTPAPQGVNTNSNYFLPGSMRGRDGLYAQTGANNSPAGGGGAVTNSTSGGGRIGAVGDSQPFNQQAPKSTWAGNLPNGARSLGK